MTMSLAALEILEEAQFPSAQARALVRVLETESAAHRAELATKSDLALLRADILQDLAPFQQTTNADLVSLKAGIASLKDSSKADIDRLEKVIKADLAHLASHKDIERAKADGMRFTLLAILGQFAVIAGAMYYLLQYTG